MLEQLYPMRAQSFDLDSSEEVWQDPEWIWELKYDGERALLHVLPHFIGMTGRRKSDVTGLLPEKGSYIPHITSYDIQALYGTVIDGELLHDDFDTLRSIMGSGTAHRAIQVQEDKGMLCYMAYDIIKYRGIYVTDLPFRIRREILTKVVSTYCTYHHIGLAIQYSPTDTDIKSLFELMTGAGSEGLMRKRLSGKYKICEDSKASSDMLKAKKLITLDGIVTGYEMGKGKYNSHLVAKLEFSQYKDGILTYRGTFDGFDRNTINDMTANITNYINRVVEVKCNDILKSGKLRHPKFDRWRDDKPPEHCIWE